MKTIRTSTFETNSSSCHTITIGTNTAPDQPDITITCRGEGEYGWDEGVEYSCPDELLDYAAVAFCHICTSDEELKERMRVIGEYFASRGVTIDWCEDEDSRNHLYEDEGHFGTNFCQGYIDHQSGPREDSDSMEIARMFRDDAEALYNFCFGGGSSIITDNDNH